MPQTRLAKLTRPRTEGLLRRERLFALLDDARDRALVWVFAPPGSGKTSLISSYIESRGLPTLWYQVDAGDADPASFFYYLGQGAAAFLPRKAKPLPLLTQEFASDVAGFARRFLRELYASLPEDAVLVLDNYQEVPERAVLHSVLDIAIGELPESRRVIGISRADVPGQLARWRAAQRVLPVGFPDLKLTQDEAVSIARGHSNLDDESLSVLCEQADGWAAGLVLMAERLRQTGGVHKATRNTNMDAVFDYFAGQILDALPSPTQTMLIRMSYLPRLTAETAQAITGDPEAVSLLAYLAKRNLFTDRRYGEDVSFQFHALFRAFLQDQAGAQLGMAEHRKVAHSAAALLQATGQMEDAFTLFAVTGAWESASALIRKEADRLVRQGRRQTLRQWIGTLPMSVVEHDGWLLYWLGICALGADHEKARESLSAAFDLFQQESNTEGQVVAASAAADSYFSMRLGWNGLELWIDRLAALLLQVRLPVHEPVSVKGTISLARAMFYRQPDRAELWVLVDMLLGFLDERFDPDERVAAAAIVIAQNLVHGNGDVCESVAARTAALADAQEVTAASRSFFYFWWISLRYFQGRLDEADDLVRRAKEISDELGLSPMAVEFERLGTATQILRGQFQRARQILEERVLPHLQFARPVAKSFYHLHMAICDLGEARAASARRHFNEAMGVVRSHGYTLAEVVNGHLEGLLLAMEGRPDEACRVLDANEARLRLCGNLRLASLTLACKALVMLRAGRSSEALDALRASFACVHERQHLWAHQSVGLLADLFAFALENEFETEFVQAFIRQRGFPAPRLDIDHWPWPLRIHALGGFEILADGTRLKVGQKAQHRLLDLLRAVIAGGQHGINSQALADALWPDSDGDNARNTLQVSLYRLRKLLGREDILFVQDGKVRLKRETCWVDAWAFDGKLSCLRELAADDPRFDATAVQALKLYRGHLLSQENEQPWILPERDRLRQEWLWVVRATGQRREAACDWETAAALYQQALAVDPDVEELYRRLMHCQHQGGAAEDAFDTYARCRRHLEHALGRKPSPDTERVLQGLRA